MIAARMEEMRTAGSGRRLRFSEVAQALGSSIWYLIAFLVLAIAVFNSGSRGGVVAGVAALLFVAIFSSRGGTGVGRVSRGVIILALTAVFTFLATSSDVLLNRFNVDIWSDGRPELYRDTIDLIAARPWLGHGAGTFVDAYPTFHTRAPSSFVWNRAHDTYLQMAAELGLPAAILVIACFAGVLVVLTMRLHRRTSPSPVAVAAVAAALAVAIQSIVDFSVQIQAVGLTLAVLVSAGFGESASRDTRPDSPSDGASKPKAQPVGPRERISVVIPKTPATPAGAELG